LGLAAISYKILNKTAQAAVLGGEDASESEVLPGNSVCFVSKSSRLFYFHGEVIRAVF